VPCPREAFTVLASFSWRYVPVSLWSSAILDQSSATPVELPFSRNQLGFFGIAIGDQTQLPSQ
jgi:hypothetical protein